MRIGNKPGYLVLSGILALSAAGLAHSEDAVEWTSVEIPSFTRVYFTADFIKKQKDRSTILSGQISPIYIKGSGSVRFNESEYRINQQLAEHHCRVRMILTPTEYNDRLQADSREIRCTDRHSALSGYVIDQQGNRGIGSDFNLGNKGYLVVKQPLVIE